MLFIAVIFQGLYWGSLQMDPSNVVAGGEEVVCKDVEKNTSQKSILTQRESAYCQGEVGEKGY